MKEEGLHQTFGVCHPLSHHDFIEYRGFALCSKGLGFEIYLVSGQREKGFRGFIK
jgi:hypothetical protein